MVSIKFPLRLISKDNEKVFGKYSHRPFLSKKYKDFEKQCAIIARSQYKGDPLEGHLKFTLTAWFKTKVHSDTMNLSKGICDAMQSVLYVNDKQIKVGHISVAEGMPEDKFEVDIEVIQ